MSLVESIRNDWHRPANLISGFRLGLAWLPAAILLARPEDVAWRWSAVATFLFIVLTDAVDGYVARRYNQVTEWGEFLDPLVDKVLIATMLVAISVVYPVLWWVTVLIVVRELVVTLQLRARGVRVPAVWSGKVKMALQAAMIVAWLVPLGGWWGVLRWTITIVAALATAWSWYDSYKRFVAANPSLSK